MHNHHFYLKSATKPNALFVILKNLEFDEHLVSHGADTLDNLLNTYILKDLK